MESFEGSIMGIVKDMHSYNLIEFYHDQESIIGQINRIKESLKGFNLYMPKYAVIEPDINKVYH